MAESFSNTTPSDRTTIRRLLDHLAPLKVKVATFHLESAICRSRRSTSSWRAWEIDGRREEMWDRTVVCKSHYYHRHIERITTRNYVARTRSRPLFLPIRQTPAHTRYVRPILAPSSNATVKWWNYQAFRSQFGSCTNPPNTRLPVCRSGCPTTIFRNRSSPLLRSSITASSNRFR